MASVRVQGRVRRRTANIARRPTIRRRRLALAAPCQRQGDAEPHRLCQPALLRRPPRRRRCCAAAPAHRPASRSRAGRLLLPRPHRARDRVGRRSRSWRCRCCMENSAQMFWLLVVARRRSPVISAQASISTGASPRARGASRRLSGFHGPAGRVRRCRPEHGVVARPGRARARPIPIRRSPPTSTWRPWKFVPAGP